MDPVDFITVVVEASVGLLGFTGVVVSFGRGSDAPVSARDRARLITLLAFAAIPLASALFSLALLSAELQPRVIWRASSLGWLVVFAPFTTWYIIWVFRTGRLDTFPWGYFLTTILIVIIAIALQLVNVAHWNAFWPYFSALAVTLGLATSQFVRLIWFKLFR